MSTLLSEKIDDQEQYTRWTCLVFEGLNSVDDDNKNLSQEIVNIVRNEHSFSVVCAKKSLAIITLIVCHHLCMSFSEKISDLRVTILFFSIYFSSLNKVYTEIQSGTTLLLNVKITACYLSTIYLSISLV